MIRSVLIAAVAGFSWPYFVDVSIPGIPPRHNSPPLTEISLTGRSKSDGPFFSSQTVDRANKGDRLDVPQTSRATLISAHTGSQSTPTTDATAKNACQQLGQGTRVANDDVVDRYNRVVLARR
jgi:hypothetical protein